MTGENNFVKLYIYQLQDEKIIVDQQEAKDFGDFIIIELDTETLSNDLQIAEMQNKLFELFPDKKVLIVDKKLDLIFYGFRDHVAKELESGS